MSSRQPVERLYKIESLEDKVTGKTEYGALFLAKRLVMRSEVAADI